MAVVDDYQDALESLAQLTAQQVRDETESVLIVAIINRARAVAVGMADVYLSRQLEDVTGEVVTATGILPTDESVRLAKAVATIESGALKTSFTRAEITELILSAGLDPDQWDIPSITRQINESLQSNLSDDPDADADYRTFEFADFIETVNENPKKLSERGLFPPPPPGTPEYEQWKIDSLVPLLDSDDYVDYPPIWEPTAEGAPVRLERLARSEVFTAAQNATTEALTKRKDKRGQFVGWVRQLEQGHCQLCKWWSRDGRVFPKSHKMATHPNCNCVQKIVISDTKPKQIRSKRRGQESKR